MNNQMNSAVRKIHNLLSSGAVTVTGPNQSRILKQKVGDSTGTTTPLTAGNSLQHHSGGGSTRCYVCDEGPTTSQAQHLLTDMKTSHTTTKFPNKIGQLVGDAYMVIVSVEDVICSRCTNLINYLDRLENDVERVRTNLMNLLHKKYGINDESGSGSVGASPPVKMQKLSSGVVGRGGGGEEAQSDVVRTRKLLQTSDTSVGKQSPPVSAVQQIKIATTPNAQHHQQSSTATAAAGTQTAGRKTTRIYKCLSCDYKTSDMRLFNTHYETCKHQNFQCKNCKKIFPNFGAMKQHMVREHSTPMDNTCSVCHFNFLNEAALRKHMEGNHSTNVVVTSTTTLPASAAVVGANIEQQHIVGSTTTTTTTMYTCNHCQFKSTDKAIFDEHLRKHMASTGGQAGGVVVSKPKPFKCRLCAQRFETREAATVHAKQHQTNYFKCGTCAMSFPKREMLVKHFEVHQQQQQTSSQAVITVKHQSVQQQKMVTTQKLLQETIDEALSDNVTVPSSGSGSTTVTTVAGDVVNSNTATAANNIRFFSCHLCSLTFIQEQYYNQHMETHRREGKKTGNTGGSVSGTTTIASSGGGGAGGGGSSLTTLNTAAALLGDDLDSKESEDVDGTSGDGGVVGGGNDGRHVMTSTGSGAANNLDADIESIFEKMHSDKSDSTNEAGSGGSNSAAGSGGAGQAQQGGESLVITSQEGTAGGITFNITIPTSAADSSGGSGREGGEGSKAGGVGIDMPVLDQADDGAGGTEISDDGSGGVKREDMNKAGGGGGAGPVSMPSLDDDGETAGEEGELKAGGGEHDPKEDSERNEAQQGKGIVGEGEASAEEESETMVSGEVSGGGEGDEGAGQQQHVAMELDEAMQAQVESGQIKFILNENGQLLQLDNIITDADGNQIIVQDPEQIQQLLQSVGVLQSGDGLVDGETLQMMTDGNGQMVIVHGENNETQLIDASLLNAEGQLVIQPGQEGEMGEGAHVISEDGTRIPVSVSYTADGEPIVQVQQQVLEAATGGGGGGGSAETSGMLEKDQHGVLETSQAGESADADGSATSGPGATGGDDSGSAAVPTSAASGGFFALEELMQQSVAATPAVTSITTAAADTKAAE